MDLIPPESTSPEEKEKEGREGKQGQGMHS